MGRPPLPVGTAGAIGFTVIAPRRIRARALFRDYDGHTRPVTRFGPTKASAERRLKEALRDRQGAPAGGRVTAQTRLCELGEVWWTEIEESDLADGSKQLYKRTLDNHVTKALGALHVIECDTPTVDQFLKAIRRNHGVGAAKSAKTVTSLLLGLAVRHGAIKVNPVTGVAKIPRGPRKRPRALTVEEEAVLLEKLAADPYAIEQDIVDLATFMLGTGVRIGEALGVRRDVIDVEGRVAEINAKSAYRKGKGGVLDLRTKTDAGWRVIALPDHIIELSIERMGMTWTRNEHGLLFPTRAGGVRLPANADRPLRIALDKIGFEWVTSHTFRKTVITRLDEAGLSAREIADHVGHEQPSMTQNVYMGRGVASASAAKVLGAK